MNEPRQRCVFDLEAPALHRCRNCGRLVRSDQPSDRIAAACHTSQPPPPPRTDAEQQRDADRLATCHTCAHFHDTPRRRHCNLIDAGCARTWRRALEAPDPAGCPCQLWPA